MELIKKSDIDSLPIEEQLNFYKKQFGYRHCELDGCGHEVRDEWVLYDGYIYCEDCYEWLKREEEIKRLEEIERLERILRELKSR